VAFDETPAPAVAETEAPTRGSAIAVGPGMDETWRPPEDALWQ